MEKHEFNIFPEMSQEEKERLISDIKENGYDADQPIITYDGKILDGWNRYNACKDLDKTPTFKVFDGTDVEAIKFVLRTNKRRNLTSSQWATIAADSEAIQHKVREEIEGEKLRKQGENARNQYSKVASGKNFPKAKTEDTNKSRKVLADMFHTNDRYVDKANKLKRVAPDLFEEVRGGKKSIVEAEKEYKKAERKRKYEEQKRIDVLPSFSFDNIDLRLGDFRDVLSDIPNNSIDLVLTDPPYPGEFIQLWSDVAKLSSRVLKDGAFFIAYSGQLHLNEVFQRVSKYLDYYWTFCLLHSGNHQLINPRNIFCGWKPLLVFQKGKKRMDMPIDDVIKGTGIEKDKHRWQQSELELKPIIEHFTNPGDLILEPFAGGGTTVAAAYKLKRAVIASEVEKSYYITTKQRIEDEFKNTGMGK